MGKRVPTRLLELRGSYKRHPERRRAGEPQPGKPLGDPPERLPVDARVYWQELADMTPVGVLTSADRWAVELCARFMLKASREPNTAAVLELARMAELSPRETKALMQAERISSAELATLRSLLSAMGMTPADRGKLSVPIEKPSNAFADLRKQSEQFRKPN